jgi:WD40 repeat protein
VTQLQGHTGWVCSVALSPDGKHIVSGSEDKAIRIWDVETGEQLRTLQGHRHHVPSIATNGRHVVSGSHDKTVRIWDFKTGEQVGESVAVSADAGNKIASGNSSGAVLIWDMKAIDAEPVTLNGHEWFVTSVAFSRNGRFLVSGSRDMTIKAWDVQTGKEVDYYECMLDVRCTILFVLSPALVYILHLPHSGTVNHEHRTRVQQHDSFLHSDSHVSLFIVH